MEKERLCTVAEIACSIAEVTGEVPLDLAKEINLLAQPGKIRFFDRSGNPRERFSHPLFGITTPGKDYPDGPWFFSEEGPYPHCKLDIVDAIKLLQRHEQKEARILKALGFHPEQRETSDQGLKISEAQTQNSSTEDASLKKSALIRLFKLEWPSIEADLQEASRNGLAKDAQTGMKGYWYTQKAKQWATKRGKIISTQLPQNSVFDIKTAK